MNREPLIPEQIAEIIRLNSMYWRGEEGGVCANLDGANLRGANLDGANLDGANLRGANLLGANLDGANLRGANLLGANLDGANLDGANLRGANLDGANLRGANLRGANLDGANLRGANLLGANLRGANLRGANLDGANLDGANLRGLRAAAMSVFSGLYEYQCWAVVSREGIPWVRMGCLWKSVEEWDRIGIRQSNVREFPNDGSEKCERRVRAFNFTKAEALRLAAKVQSAGEAAPEPAPPYTEGDEVRLTEAGRTMWPWAPTSAGTVVRCCGGWTRIEFDDCFLSIPDDYLERTSGGAK